MKILDIKESGASNTLLWALSNGADIKTDMPLASIINDETFYLVTMSDVNFFELYRMTQMYRDKLRILNENIAAIPQAKLLKELFPGEYQAENESMELSSVAEHVMSKFIDLTSQMSADDDIIQPGAIRLFLPMLTRTFDIQIPVSFMDIVESMTDEECSKLFTQDYPGTLREVINAESHGIKTVLSMAFVKSTQILKYDNRYDQYLKLTKYAPIKSYTDQSKLYKFGLLGFAKKDNVTRGEVRCNLFKANQSVLASSMKRMARINTPLELDFAIQIPIQYMQILENTFGRDMLKIVYESSMTSIIDGGITYNDFKTIDYPVDADDADGQAKLQTHNNAIEAYRVRITEANQVLLNMIPIMINSGNDVDVTSTFAMLPSLYTAKAVITLNTDTIDKFVAHPDPLLSEMFLEMQGIANGVMEDIRKSK